MSKPIQIAASVACRSLCIPVLLCATSLYTSCAFAAPELLPHTPAGKLADQLIHHINTDTPVKIRDWAPTVLSTSSCVCRHVVAVSRGRCGPALSAEPPPAG